MTTGTDSVKGRNYKIRLIVLLGSTALLPEVAIAQSACTMNSPFQSCSGDLSMGVVASSPMATVDVYDLDSNIVPVSGVVGILYETDTAATLLSNTGPFEIVTTEADSIRVGSIDGEVYINHTGNITSAGGRGILAFSDNGGAVIEGSGNVAADLDAISTNPRAGGAAVNWSGNIFSTSGRGLFVKADNGSASASGKGEIDAALDAVTIDSRGAGGNTSFIWEGKVTSQAANAVTASSANGGASVRGTGNIDAAGHGIVVDARGATSNASANWTGNIKTEDGHGARVYSADGGADIMGSGAVEAGDFGFHVESDKVGSNAALSWVGPITSRLSFGALVQTAGGGATITGSGAVTAAADGLFAEAIGGNAQVNWNGAINAGDGSGVKATSNSGGASISGSGMIQGAQGGLFARTTSSSSAVANWQGDITSAEGTGLSVFSSAGATSARGSGNISGGVDAVSITNTGAQAAALDWDGNFTARTGFGAFVFSSNGNVSADGSGTVISALDAFHLETEGNSTAALNWTGNITSNSGKAVHVSSAQGPVSSTTTGTINAGGGGIYAFNGTANSGANVAVNHTGALSAGGVGVEARSPSAAVSVRVLGNMQTGAHGIFAESRGSQTVAVIQDGAMETGNTAIDAYSSTGTVSVAQTGTVLSFGKGISAVTEGGSTVSVVKFGDLSATDDGIFASSATGRVIIRLQDGDLRAGGTGIAADNKGNDTVIVEMTGDVTADEDAVRATSANGQVYARVVGTVTAGGNGVVAMNTGSGEVGVIQTGDVTAEGDGLVAASATGNASVTLDGGKLVAKGHGFRLSGFGNLSANVGAGASVLGGAGSAGVFFDTGLGNTVTNYGSIANAGGVDEFAILSENNDTLVVNHGTITGNVRLGPWANAFFNLDGALLESGSELSLGLGNTVTNEGTLSPGGTGEIMSTVLDGNLVTLAGSKLLLDVDMRTSTTDALDLTGSAALAGDVTLRFTTVRATPVSYTFMTTDLGVLSQTLSVTDNPFVTASVETVNSGNDVRLTVSDVDMAPAGLRGAGNIIAQYLDRAVSAGGDGVDLIAASVVNSGSLNGAQAIYGELAPSAYLDKFSATYQSALKFSDSMMSCSVPSGLIAPGAEGSCNWSRTTMGQNTQDSSGGQSVDTSTVNSAFGLQRVVGDGDWRIGGAFGILQAETTSDAGDRSVATNLQIGASIKYAPGPFVLAGAISSSAGDVNTTRYVTIGEETERLYGETNQRTFSLKLRGSYVHESGSLYLKPQADFNATLVKSDGFSEAGGSAALKIEGMSDVIFSIAPAVEVGVTHRDTDGGVLRAFGRIGATFQSQGGVNLTSALVGDATGVTGFTLGTNGDKEVLNLGMGFIAFNAGGWSTEAQINWNIGERTNEHLAMVKLRTTF